MQVQQTSECAENVRDARILVVDDDASICRVLVELLRTRGYAVECVNSAREARERGAESRYDAALVDVGLADGCGGELARELERGSLRERVILMTGGNAPDFPRVLYKPFRYAVLLAQLSLLTQGAPCTEP